MRYEERKKPIDYNALPLVSVITPVYNAASFIAQTITSIQKQSYQNWELIVVDDASTDQGPAIISRLAQQDARIQFHPLSENHGAAYCRNMATKFARGDYIAFCDADDLWFPQKLEKQVSFMETERCLVSFSSYLHIDEDGHSLQKRVRAMPYLTYRKQRRNNYIGNLTGMYNASAIGKIEAPNIRKRQDWAVWLEAIRRSGSPALGIQEDLAYYRVRPGSISANKLKLVRHNYLFYRKHLAYGPLKSLYFLLLFFREYFFVRPTHIERL
jgi:glycosyltransferase involved in cell wall biosynthesis